MRVVVVVCAALLVVASGGVRADSQRPQVSSRQCGLTTPFNVLVDGGGVWLYREDDLPREIHFRRGELSVDGRVQEVSAEDAQRLRQMEAIAGALMPEVAGLARETADIVFDAFAGVIEAMTGSARKARSIDRYRNDALMHIDRTLGAGRWDQDVFDGQFEGHIEAAAEAMAGSIGRSVLWAVFTGRAGHIERRAERMATALEQRIEQRTHAIEARADALCTQVDALHALQSALDYRYDGAALELLQGGVVEIAANAQ